LIKINARLAELPFIAQTQPWNVEMLNTGSVLNLYLEKQAKQPGRCVGWSVARQ